MSADLQPFLDLLPTKLAADESGNVKLKWAAGEGPFGHAKPLAANPAACTIRPLFPAYVGHRVSPVERGTRRSLVAWAYGPSFR